MVYNLGVDTIKTIYTYLLTVPVFFAMDMIWLGVIAKSFYAKQLSNFLTSNVNWVAAIIFYLLYIIGIIYFAVLPGIEKNSLKTVIISAALFGGLAYATYDLTNLATLKNWPMPIVIVDIIWGVVLTTTVAIASYNIAQWLK
jgi:uncharacterized membrane protein